MVALNAWAHHWKRFRRTVVVRGSYIVMTAPAPERLKEIGWTDGSGVADMRSAVHYVRTTPDGRISFGLGGMQPNLARRIGPRFAYDARAIEIAIADLHRMFPGFVDVPLEAAWGGPIDVSGHHLPTFGTLGKGNVHYGHGYTGNGVGPAHLGGRSSRTGSSRRSDPVLDLPLVDLEPLRFPPEPVRSPGALVANTAIRRKDEAEDAGEEPNPVGRFRREAPPPPRLQPRPLGPERFVAGSDERPRVRALPGFRGRERHAVAEPRRGDLQAERHTVRGDPRRDADRGMTGHVLRIGVERIR